MTQHSGNETLEPLAGSANVPLSDRPLVADDENTVISSPEASRSEVKIETASSNSENDAIRNRLFPSNGVYSGEEVGIRLAHFQITGRLGSGGMGAVFKATDLELARDVALKILNPSSSNDPSLVARFRNEARACAQLNHDNIARVFWAGSQDGLYFIAYEFATGSTIRDLIVEKGCVSPADTINYAIQVTLALNHTAAAGIVHRDIKPSNIMLTDSGRIKVVDLGLARRDTTDSIGDITMAGTTLGTFDYIAPEQARDPRNADERSDIYSLGCTMYHMLTGRPPYPEGTALQKLLDHQGKTPPDPRTLNSGVPEELAAIMRKMMANDPEGRYQAPGLLLNDLIQMAQLLGLHSVPAEGIVWRQLGPAGRRQPLGAVWVFVSVLLICVTAVVLQQVHRPNDIADATDADHDDLGELVDQLWPMIRDADSVGPPASPAVSAVPETSKVTGSGTSKIESSAANSKTENGTPGVPGLKSLPGDTLLPFPILSPINAAVASMGLNQTKSNIPVAPTPASGPFVLQRSGGMPTSFRTLKAAVADARSGDVVLLQYNGYPDDLKTQPPVRIAGMDLIIRAGDGCRPTLVFDGAPEGTASPGQIISLRGNGKLSLQDVDLRVVVRDDLTADRWSLFHCTGPNNIELSNVSIDFINAEGQPAALFELAGDVSGADSDKLAATEITLTRVICRAESQGFRIASQARGRIQLRNCGIALGGSLIDNRGDSSMTPSRGAVEVLLNHVTCLTSAPMLKMNDTDSQLPGGVPRLIPRLAVKSDGSVFAAHGTDECLMATDGSSFVEDLESLVSWNGFNNLYDGFQVYWKIETSALDYAPRHRDFTQWVRFWGDRTDSEETNSDILREFAWQNGSWKSDSSEAWLRNLTPSSFELNGALFNPRGTGLQLARDNLVPGVNAAELPRFPQLPSPPTSPREAPIVSRNDIPKSSNDRGIPKDSASTSPAESVTPIPTESAGASGASVDSGGPDQSGPMNVP